MKNAKMNMRKKIDFPFVKSANQHLREPLKCREISMRPLNPLVSPVRTRRFRSLTALDALNFFQADVHGGVGPFLVTFLATSLHWTPDRIGTVMFASRIAGLCAQPPTGALVNKLKAKRLIVAVSAALIALACIAIVKAPKLSGNSGGPILYRGSRCLFWPRNRRDFNRLGWSNWTKPPDWP
jgi:hypothetical protein